MPSVLLEKLIQRQINQWNRFRQLLGEERTAVEIARPTLTVSRQLGSGGRNLAEALAEHLELQVHGHEIVDRIARDKNLETDVVRQLDEQVQSQINLWIKGALSRRIFLRDEFHVALVRAVRTLAAGGGVVILGRGGNLVLAETAALRLRVVAPRRTRRHRVAEAEGIDLDLATALVADSDESRARFVRDLFHADIDDPQHYDLVLNSDTLDRDTMLELALSALKARSDGTEIPGEMAVTG